MTHTKSNCEITLSLVFFLQRQTLQNVLFPLDANEGATQTTPIRAARDPTPGLPKKTEWASFILNIQL